MQQELPGQRGADGGLRRQPGPQPVPALVDQRYRRRHHESDHRRRHRDPAVRVAVRPDRLQDQRRHGSLRLAADHAEPPLQQRAHGRPAMDLRPQHRQHGRIQRSADHAESVQLRAGSRQQRLRRAPQRQRLGPVSASGQAQVQGGELAGGRLGSRRNRERPHRLADRRHDLAAGHRLSDQRHQPVRAGADRHQRRGDHDRGDRQPVRRRVPQQPPARAWSRAWIRSCPRATSDSS